MMTARAVKHTTNIKKKGIKRMKASVGELVQFSIGKVQYLSYETLTEVRGCKKHQKAF